MSQTTRRNEFPVDKGNRSDTRVRKGSFGCDEHPGSLIMSVQPLCPLLVEEWTKDQSALDVVRIEATVELEWGALAEIPLENIAIISDSS